jgi:hypothetical protein
MNQTIGYESDTVISREKIARRWPDVHQFNDAAPSYEVMATNIDAMRETTKNYYAWMADSLRPFLGRRTMEVGAGPGFLSNHLVNFDLYLITETWVPFIDDLRRRTALRPEVEVMSFDVIDLKARCDEIRSLRLDSMFSTNMLEHLSDDIEVLRDMARPLHPGGCVVNLVPAYRRLYGRHDLVIGHFRRYEPAELRAKMEAAGLTVERILTFNQAGVFAWLATSKFLRRSNASGSQYATFDRLVPLFRLWERIVPIPIGLSLIGVGHVR